MIVNGRKTKEILIGSVLCRDPPLSVILSGAPQAARRARRQQLQVGAACQGHLDQSCIAPPLGLDDLLCFYGTVVRPVLEYACSAWHSSLTAAQPKALEAIQWRAMRIIFAHSDYEMALMLAGLDPLEAQRARLTERFFRRSVLSEESCLNYLLPDKRDSSVTGRLRHAKTFEPLPASQKISKFFHSLLFRTF